MNQQVNGNWLIDPYFSSTHEEQRRRFYFGQIFTHLGVDRNASFPVDV